MPTVYDILDIRPPRRVNGIDQEPIDGVSMTYTFDDANADGKKRTQYFENNASRGIYHEGWFACTFGPFLPWDTATSAERLRSWDPKAAVWELNDLTKDYSQAENLADREPTRLENMRQLFLKEAKDNQVLPIGGGLWTRIHPEDVIRTPYTSWQFDETTQRMPEFPAPGLGKQNNVVVVDVEIGKNASGVLYALGGNLGGLTLFMDNGQLIYEYNMLLVERYRSNSPQRIPAGKHRIEVQTQVAKPGAPATVIIRVDGQEHSRTQVSRTVPGAFTASETFDVGLDLGSPVARDYDQRRPFRFDGRILGVTVTLK